MGWDEDDFSDHDWAREASRAVATPTAAPPPVTTIGSALPPVVVVPAHPRVEGSGIELELVRLDGDTAAVVAFSTVAGLVAQLGADQPWLMVRGEAVLALARTAATVVLDPVPGTCEQWWTPERVATIGAVRRGSDV